MNAMMFPLAIDVESFFPDILGDRMCPLLESEELTVGRLEWWSPCRVGVSLPPARFVAGLEPLHLCSFFVFSLVFPLASLPVAFPELPAVQSV